MSVGQDLLNVPFGEMVVQLASAIAEGQFKLDMVSIEIAKMMGDPQKAPIVLPSLSDPSKSVTMSMIAAGFIPTFYQFVDSIIEVKMAISMTKTSEFATSVQAKVGWGCFSASVNASYSSKYSYSVEGSSLLRTKIVPVPVPKMLEERLKALIDKELEKIKKEETPVTPTPP